MSLGGVESNLNFVTHGLRWIPVYLAYWVTVAVVIKVAVDLLPLRFNAAVHLAGIPLMAYVGWFAVANNLTTIFLLVS